MSASTDAYTHRHALAVAAVAGFSTIRLRAWLGILAARAEHVRLPAHALERTYAEIDAAADEMAKRLPAGWWRW